MQHLTIWHDKKSTVLFLSSSLRIFLLQNQPDIQVPICSLKELMGDIDGHRSRDRTPIRGHRPNSVNKFSHNKKPKKKNIEPNRFIRTPQKGRATVCGTDEHIWESKLQRRRREGCRQWYGSAWKVLDGMPKRQSEKLGQQGYYWPLDGWRDIKWEREASEARSGHCFLFFSTNERLARGMD